MGKAIIVKNISFESNNLGKVTFTESVSRTAFHITANENITISFPKNLEYNDGVSVYWKAYNANTVINLSSGDSIAFKGNVVPRPSTGIGSFSISGSFNVSGDILSLTNGVLKEYGFKYLFKDCIGLEDASNLELPSITTNNCYEGMFKGCTSLTDAPSLPAAVLSSNCYKELFYGCSSLNHINISTSGDIGSLYTSNWVYGVAAIGILYKLPNDITYEVGVNGSPTGWTVKELNNLLYFTIESLQDSNLITLQNVACNILPTFSYSTDNGETWTDVTAIKSTTVNVTTINTGEKIIFKGINDTLATAYNTYNRFNGSKKFKVYGNTMSLLYGDNFANNSEFPTNSTFNLCGLFYNTTTVIDASDLVLPALTCTESCYNGMFRGATGLTVAPELPATAIVHDSYSSFFEGCINLEVAPEINVTSITGATAMARMFCMNRNSKITTPKMTKSPVLRCKNGDENCYKEMFKGNGNLVEVTCLLENPTTNMCNSWLSNCSSTGVFKKAADVEWTTDSDSGIKSGWTVETYIEE